MNSQKFTTNYQVFIDQDNKVHCARCRFTGKFIHRNIAQVEYEAEYTYPMSKIERIWALLVCFIIGLVEVLAEDKKPVKSEIDSLSDASHKALQSCDLELWHSLQRQIFEIKYKTL